MAIPVIPESAPFDAKQRAWLNGFFAGLLNLSAGGTTSIAESATALVEAAPAGSGEDAEDFPWHDSSLSITERLQLADGRPLEHRLMAAMAQLNCGACGYLCQTYSAAIACGEESDLSRCSPGGSETHKALKQITSALGAAKPTNGHVAIAKVDSVATTAVKYNRSNPYYAKLKESIRLTDPEAPKDTRHVVIDLKESGITYEPGDSLGILPLNDPQLVEEVLAAAGFQGDELVPMTGIGEKSLREFLTADVTLTRVRGGLLELLTSCATNPAEAKVLQQIQDEDSHELANADVAELLQRFPSARPTLEQFAAALPRLQPRLYSISSAQRAHPDEVHLTIGVVRFEILGRWRNGLASHFLGIRSNPGDAIRVFVQHSKFRLPENPSTPVIMVGPGTGIAPFRAFLEHRSATKAPGKNWLFFGNQYRAYDFLYREELEGMHESGVLTRLDVAFSRDRAEKVYVQHRMLEHGSDVWQWLQEGAHFYVCGDAKRMAHDVDQALQQIVAKYGNKSAEEAKAYVTQLVKSKRYQKDVY